MKKRQGRLPIGQALSCTILLNSIKQNHTQGQALGTIRRTDILLKETLIYNHVIPFLNVFFKMLGTQDVRENTRTGTITYRDGEGKLKSIFKEDYETFDCRN